MSIKRLLILTSTILLGLTLAMMWLMFLSGPPGSAHAASYTVCPAGPTTCDYSSIQDAVDAAGDGDVIKVAAGNYTGVQERPAPAGYGGPSVITQVVYISKTLTIRGGYTTAFAEPPDPAINQTTLDAQGQGRVLFITGDISPTVEGLHITGGDASELGGGGYGDKGNGVYVLTATATISNNHVFSNTTPSHYSKGGGVYLNYSDATLSGNTVFNNNIGYNGSGGGLYLNHSDATLTENIISDNSGGFRGGGLYLDYSDATLSGNTISSNHAWAGGGLYLDYSDATLSGNTIISNTTAYDGRGGGLWLSESNATLNGNTISDNIAGWEGGGLRLSSSNAMLNNNNIFNNTAGHVGGGLYLFDSDASLTNNVIADNRAGITGSGLYISSSMADSSTRLLHSTITRNSGGDGSGVYVTGDLGTNTVILANTILVSQTVGIYVRSGNTAMLEGTLWGGVDWANGTDWAGDGTVITGTVNLWGDPDFVDPAGGDYHIGPDSDAIDAGINAGVATDIDGETRPDGEGCLFDIGADEFITGECKRVYLPVVLRSYVTP